MRWAVAGFLLALSGCGSPGGHFESNIGAAPSCQAGQSLAGQYRCEGWSLLARSRTNGPDSQALQDAATVRFQIGDALDQGGMTPEEAARLRDAFDQKHATGAGPARS